MSNTDLPSSPLNATRTARMSQILMQALAPDTLEINDESYQHKGHRGWREEGETHYRLKIVASAFETMNRVARHRYINMLLADEFANGLHALSLITMTPEENKK